MSSQNVELGHGHSVAAWTAVTIMLTATLIGAIAFFLDAPIIVCASAMLLIIGLLVGWVLARSGYGVGGSKTVHTTPS